MRKKVAQLFYYSVHVNDSLVEKSSCLMES